ncbi:MAG TPA: hypothetical protein VFG55_07405 [Rhodanobacteraceae bacterium]|nr:hypothetical protein [Rhodanobacteraceae bacterium]
MNKWLRSLILGLALLQMAGMAAASDVEDGKALVKPAAHDRYAINGYIMGKAELFGYISDLKDQEHLDGLVLRSGGSDAQRQAIGSIARTLQLKAFELDGGDLKPMAPGS